MRSKELLFAFGQIADDIIEEAADAVRPAREKTHIKSYHKKRSVRRATIGIAATLILLLGSFVTAMAVSAASVTVTS